jgi:hypothetical protein
MIVAAASGSVGETIAPRTKATPHRGQERAHDRPRRPHRSVADLYPGRHVDVGHAGSALTRSRWAGSAEEKLLRVPRE